MLASCSLPLAARGGMAGRPAHRSDDIPNVYFAGDWVGQRGYLVDASLESARESARLILQGAPPIAVTSVARGAIRAA
jgi:hypothetical protein